MPYDPYSSACLICYPTRESFNNSASQVIQYLEHSFKGEVINEVTLHRINHELNGSGFQVKYNGGNDLELVTVPNTCQHLNYGYSIRERGFEIPECRYAEQAGLGSY